MTLYSFIRKKNTNKLVKSFLDNQPFREFTPPKSNRVIISRSHGDWFDSYIKDHLAMNATVISAGGSGKLFNYKSLFGGFKL